MCLPTPFDGSWSWPLVLLLWSAGGTRGLVSTDAESSACALLCVHLVHLSVLFLKGGSIKAIAQHGSETGNVLSGLQLFHAALIHLALDFVLDRLHLGGGLCKQRLPLFQGFDLLLDAAPSETVSGLGLVHLCIVSG